MKQISSKYRLIVFLVASVIPFDNNLTAFLIVASLVEGYMLIESIDAIVIFLF